MRRLALLPASFRARFLLVVFGAAVVPLVLIGVWLTRSVVRAGEQLLRSELDQSLQRVAIGIESRWSYRRGDLALLTNNEAAQRLLAGASSTLTADDSLYLDQLVAALAPTIPSFEYRDTAGDVRWSSPAPQGAALDSSSPAAPGDTTNARLQGLAPSVSSPTLTVRLPVGGSRTRPPLGELIARVDLAALVAVDPSLRLPSGARLQVVQRGTGQALLPAFAIAIDWLTVHRSIDDPDVTLAMSAPLGAYVQPFEHAARTGVITLAVVALLALLLSAWLTTRLTSSLERLAVAADAVARGDLDHRVEGHGAGEVGRLAAAFNSMTESLRRTLGELSKRQALAAAGEFAASLSHEVRNGLTAVRVDLQRAEEKTADGTPSRSLIARALENVKRLDATVSGSLRVARSGQNPRRRLDLGPVAAAAAQSADSTFAECGATLDPLANSSSPAWVLGDAVALEQLLLNLLRNSAQAMGPGGRASLTVTIDGSDVRIVVSDSGPGISPGDLQQVLDPFFSTKTDGTGLGLPIARQIAAAHGGSLTIESVPGDGTRVEVRLPLAAAPT